MRKRSSSSRPPMRLTQNRHKQFVETNAVKYIEPGGVKAKGGAAATSIAWMPEGDSKIRGEHLK